MPQIRPVSDLRNHFTEITQEIQATGEPIFLTKNGAGSIVVMSMDAYEQGRYESEVYAKLMEAEIEAETTDLRYSHEDVMKRLRSIIQKSRVEKNAN